MKSAYLHLTVLTFILVSCGGGGGGGSGSAPTPPTTPAPTVNLSAEPTSVLLESTSTLTWSSTNTTSCSASWTSQTGTSGSEAVTITTVGSNSFSITCSGVGGSRSDSVTVEGFRETDGVVVDGYISGAEVCIDEDESWTCDASENSTTSDNEGKFTIRYANGNLVSIGGTDLDSQTLLDNLLITHKLTGHSDFKAVTPVTSVAAFMEDASLVNAALGIDLSIDVFSFDPVANKGDGGINDYLYEKGNQLTVLAFALQNITNNLNTTTETTQDYFKAITEEIEKEYTETETKVDIETQAFVTKVFENVIAAKSVTIDEIAKANVTKALSGMLPIIQVKSSDDLTTGVIRFAVSTLQTDIQAIANGTAIAETITSYTEDLLNYIAEDQSIDSGEIAPDINAIADTVNTAEDTAVEINVLLNDSYVTSSPFSLSATNGTNGSTSISNNLITYSPDANYNGSDSFSYTLTQGDKTSSSDVTINIEAVNDTPSIDIASTIQVEENQTTVTTVSVSDVDGDELTLTLGGTDADSFNLSDENVLTFKEAPDYEAKDSYSVTLTLTDGIETVTKDITVTIIDVEENGNTPVITSSSTFTADENQTAIGTVTATDADGDDITFSISGSEININASTGVLTFASAPDYETKSSYTATVTASDGTNSTTQDIAISINNVIESGPVFSSPNSFNIDENETVIGIVSATSAESDSMSYSIIGSEPNININESSGELTFITAIDCETNGCGGVNQFSVEACDGYSCNSQSISVTVNNINDNAPNITSSSNFNPNENQTTIGTVVAEDSDGDSILFSITGADVSLISIDASSGLLTFNTAPDYEEDQTSYSITVEASDGLFNTNQDLSISLANAIDQPTITENQNFIVVEDSNQIGTLEYFDPDSNIQEFTLTGPDASNFSIEYDTGVLGGGAFDHDLPRDEDADNIYELTVSARTNNFGTLTSDFTVTIINDESQFTPTLVGENIDNTSISFGYSNDLSNDGRTIVIGAPRDNSSLGKALVYQLEGSNWIQKGDPIVGTGTEDNVDRWGEAVSINSDGSIIAIAGSQFDSPPIYNNGHVKIFEWSDNNWIQKGSDILGVADSQNMGRKEGGRAIDLSENGNTIIVGSALYRPENANRNGKVEVWEFVNNNWALKGSEIIGDTNTTSNPERVGNSVSINAEGNVIAYGAPGWENPYTLSGQVKVFQWSNDSWSQIGSSLNGDGTDQLGIDVRLNEAGNKIVILSRRYVQVWEINEGTLTQIGTNIEESCLSGDFYGGSVDISDEGEFIAISAPTCDGGIVFLYEWDGSSWLRNIENIYKPSTYIGEFGWSVSLSGNNDRVAVGTPQNRVLGVYKTTENLFPLITSSSTFASDENQTAIGTVTATDADGNNLTFSISGSEININASTGVLTFASAPDYETKSSYSSTVTVSDGTNSTTQNITVNINNVNDNSPVFDVAYSESSNKYWWWMYEEQNQISCDNAFNRSSCKEISATDADGDTISYSMDNITGVSSGEISINPSTGIITLNNADYDSGVTEVFADIIASDGANSESVRIRIQLKDDDDITFYLYAHDGPFLGCIAGNDCEISNSDSLCNDSGNYGNPSSTNSIWYPYSGYGATNNIYSPWYRGSDETKPNVYKKENNELVYINKFMNVGFTRAMFTEFYITNSVNGSHSNGREFACGGSYWD